MNETLNIFKNLLFGFKLNIIIFTITLVFSLPLGLILALLQNLKLKFLNIILKFFIWIIRGTPLMLQLFIVFYVPGLIFNTPFKSRNLAVIIAFIINYSCYFAVIWRGAIFNIPKSQIEASYSLGLNKYQTFKKITFMELLRLMLAPVGNEVISLVKDTSLARVIGISEILMKASEYTSKGIIAPIFYSGIFFLFSTFIITLAFDNIETKITRYWE